MTTAEPFLSRKYEAGAVKAVGLCLLLSLFAHAVAVAAMPALSTNNIEIPVPQIRINLVSLAAPEIQPQKIEPAAGEEVKEVKIVPTEQPKEVIPVSKPKPKTLKKLASLPAQKPIKKEQIQKIEPRKAVVTNNDRGQDKSTVIPLLRDVNILRQTPPEYPSRARRMGRQGTVVLHALVNGDGRTETLKVVSSSGHQSLDRSAVNAVENWTFEAATRDGKPMKAWVEVPVRFVLN